MALELTIDSVTDGGTLADGEVIAPGNDVLVVVATDSDGNEYAAQGSVSHTTNYFPPSDYATFYLKETGVVDEQGNPATEWTQLTAGENAPEGAIVDTHRVDGAVARAMTPAEVGEYALELVLAQNPALQLANAPEPAPVVFQAPAPVSIADAPST